MQRGTITTNTNEASFYIGPVRTINSVAGSSGLFYIRSESGLICMVPYILRNNYSSDGSLTIILSNGTSIYHVSIVPRNPFSYWIPSGMLTNTLAPISVVHVPNFSVPLSYFLWNCTYPVIRHTPRFLEMNHGPGHMILHPSNFYMAQHAMPQTFDVDVESLSNEGLLSIQDRVENVNRGLSMEVLLERMKCIKYQSIERSISDNDTCCICLDDFSDGQIIGSADCQHTFHFSCISSCPLCKRIALAI